MKNGKKPLSEKKAPAKLTADMVFGGSNTVPEDVAAEMKEKGWVPRWLNAKTVYSNQGYHTKGWRVYRRAKSEGADFRFGNDPDGVVRRGDLILGYKEKDQHKLHKEFLEQQSAALAGSVKNAARDLKETAREIGLDTKIDEGYDEEDDE